MQTSGIDSAWASDRAQQATASGASDFTQHLAKSRLTVPASGVHSGGQLLSDDMARALASYTSVTGAAVR